jgi:hypothetical protein
MYRKKSVNFVGLNVLIYFVSAERGKVHWARISHLLTVIRMNASRAGLPDFIQQCVTADGLWKLIDLRVK